MTLRGREITKQLRGYNNGYATILIAYVFNLPRVRQLTRGQHVNSALTPLYPLLWNQCYFTCSISS